MDVEITQLRWFQQVSDGITLTEISDLESVSQSGVSRALGRLESEIGVPLLRRSGRVLRMTRAGAAFKPFVDRSLAVLDDGVAVLAELTAPDTGTVAIAFQPSLGGWLVPRLVARFRAANPQVRFDLQLVQDVATGQALAAGTADVEITAIPPAGAGVKSRPLVVEALYLAVAESHPLARRPRQVRLGEVAEETFVALRPEFSLRGICETLCAHAGFAPRIGFEGEDVATLIGFVAAGLGVAIAPRPHNQAQPEAAAAGGYAAGGVVYLPIDDPDASRTIRICWSSERRLPPVVDRFRRHVIGNPR